MRVRYGLGVGTVDAMTQSIIAIRMDDGRYVLAKWGDAVYVA